MRAKLSFKILFVVLLFPFVSAQTNPGDLNSDNQVDILDIVIVVRDFGLTSGFNPVADLNSDNRINIFDLVKVARHWGKRYGTDNAAPSIVSSRPTGILGSGTGNVVLGIITDERSYCKYSSSSGTSFSGMSDFTNSNSTSHAIELTGLVDGTGYSYYVLCRDESNNFMSSEYLVSFSVGGNPPPTCTNGQTRQCGTSNVGACSFGNETCNNGAWGSCVGAINSTTEICEGSVDENCDGQVDEGCSQPSTTVDFDNPPIGTGNGGGITGVWEGIDFGTGQWLWESGYNANPTNHIFFSSGTGTSRTFDFVAPSVLNNINVFTINAGTLTLSDDSGQTFNQQITTGSMQIVNTGWTQASTTVTVDFTSGWDLGVDDITFGGNGSGPSCSCGSWTDNVCGAGTCLNTEMQQTRTCSPSACQVETRCVSDASCSSPPVCDNDNVCESGNGETCSNCPGDCRSCGSTTVYFHSDWSTATGNSLAALLDQSGQTPWGSYVTQGQTREYNIISDPTGLAPTTNVLEVTAAGAAEFVELQGNEGYLPTLNVGQSLYGRYYSYWAQSIPTSQPGIHGDNDGLGFNPPPLDANAQHKWERISSSQLSFGFRTEGGNSPDREYWGNVPINVGEWYRIEWQILIVSSTEYELHVRVYDDQNTLVMTDTNFIDGSNTLADSIPNLVFPGGDGIASFRGWRMGINGWSGGSGVARYNTGVAFCDDWCGPYPIAGVEDSGGSGSNVLFSCDWPTVGTSVAAVTDCGSVDWPRYPISNSLAVIPDPYDFPTANVFEVTTGDGDPDYLAFGPNDGIINDVMGLGDRRGYRWYYRYVLDQNPITDDDTHGHFLNNQQPIADSPPSLAVVDLGGGGGTLSWQMGHGTTPSDPILYSVWMTPGTADESSYYVNLQPQTTYRIETLAEVMQVTPEPLVRYHMRIYDESTSSTVPLYDNDDFGPYYGLYSTLADAYAAGESWSLQTQYGDLSSFSSMWIGLNGWEAAQNDERYVVYGGLAICDDWCGAYPIAGVED